MSNFLMRIVSTVAPAQAYPRPRLQPLFGSVFAPGNIPVASVGAHFPSDSEMAASPYRGVSRSIQPTGDDPPSITPSPVEPASLFHQGATSPLARNQHPPLLPINQIGEAPSHLPPPGARQLVRRDADTGEAKHQAEAVIDSNPRTLEKSAPPQTPGETIPTRPPPTHPPLMRLAPKRPAPAIPQPQTARREPDEIHIHIGRIEVAAIAAPAPRPTSAPPRKTLSLDDYLRRGNGTDGKRG